MYVVIVLVHMHRPLLLFSIHTVPTGYPQNVIALTRTSTTIELQWGPVPLSQRNGDIILYEVELNQTTFPELPSPELRNTSGDELMLALTGLQEYVEYTMRVRAYTSAGPGPYSPPVSNMTQTDGEWHTILCYLTVHIMFVSLCLQIQ